MGANKTLIGEMVDRARGESSSYNYGNLTSRNNFYCSSGVGTSRILTYPYPQGLMAPVYDKAPHIFLLNTNEVLEKESRKIPLFATNFTVDNSKIIGYAGPKLSSSDTKEGVVDIANESLLGNPKAMGSRWRFDYDKANGTFNKVCFGANPLFNRFDGFGVCRDIGIGYDATTFTGGLYGYYIRPGVSGITGDKEILIGESATDSEPVYARYKYNLETGVTTEIQSTDPLYNLKCGRCNIPQVVYNGYLYVIDKANAQIRKINISTLSETTYGINSSYLESNSLFLYNGYIYVYYNNTCYAYNPDNLISDSSHNITSLGLPSEFNAYAVKIGNAGDNFVVACMVNSSTFVNCSVECTDITNIDGSIVDIQFGIISPVCYKVNMTVGTETRTFKVAILREFNTDGMRCFKNGGTDISDDFQKTIKISIEWWGNMLGYYELDTPVTKDSTMVKYVSFGFDVSES